MMADENLRGILLDDLKKDVERSPENPSYHFSTGGSTPSSFKSFWASESCSGFTKSMR